MFPVPFSHSLFTRTLAVVRIPLPALSAFLSLFRLPRSVVALDLMAYRLRNVELRLLGCQFFKDLQVLRLLLVRVLNERVKLTFLTLRFDLNRKMTSFKNIYIGSKEENIWQGHC